MEEFPADVEERVRLEAGLNPNEWAAISRTRLPVLITGETGTGKSRLAREIHAAIGGRAPFIEVNTAALAGGLIGSELFGHERGAFTGAHSAKAGLVALANEGSLFLDEIGDLSPESQVQLLSFMDEGMYRAVGSTRLQRSSARIIAATNRDLRQAVVNGSFRADLFHRLASISVVVRPLRERRGAIPELARRLVQEAALRHGMEPVRLRPEAFGALDRHDWPGNVRELRFLLERVAVAHAGQEVGAGEILTMLCPREFPPEREEVVRPLAEMEREMVARALRVTGGNRTQAAKLLGITPRGLYNKLEGERAARAASNLELADASKVTALPLRSGSSKASQDPAA